jgi:hypothetical protein
MNNNRIGSALFAECAESNNANTPSNKPDLMMTHSAQRDWKITSQWG